MKPYQDSTMLVADSKTLDTFKDDIKKEIHRCGDMKKFDFSIIERIMRYYKDIVRQRRNDLKDWIGESEDFLHPKEFEFIKYLHGLIGQTNADDFDKLNLIWFDTDHVPKE